MCQIRMHVRLVVGTVHLMLVGIWQPEFHVRSVTEAVVKKLLQPFVRLAVALVTRQRRPCVHSADRISSPLIDKMAVTSTEAFLFCALRQSCVRSCRLLHPDAVLDADRHLALTAAATAWKLQLAVTGRIGSRQQLAVNAWLVSLGCSGGPQWYSEDYLHIIQRWFRGKPILRKN